MTALGDEAPNVVGLVYIAAFAPTRARPWRALLGRPAHARIAHMFTDSRGYGCSPEDDFVSHFAADVDPIWARVMYAVQQALALSAFEDVMGFRLEVAAVLVSRRSERRGDPARRRAAVRATDGREHGRDPSSHVAMVTHPAEVAELIERQHREADGEWRDRSRGEPERSFDRDATPARAERRTARTQRRQTMTNELGVWTPTTALWC